MSIFIIILTIIIVYIIDMFLVALAWQCLRQRFKWAFSRIVDFIILFLLFACLDVYPYPAASILDITYTIHNESVVNFLSISPNGSVMDFFGFGIFEIVLYAIEALLSIFIGKFFAY
ncbi:MAG: hypothetical protein SWH68_07685 [Thermodesulfobacteriota bacterium]|nr:hypothetical protein [Thermodesulfobacteriota bacterium]